MPGSDGCHKNEMEVNTDFHLQSKSHTESSPVTSDQC